MASVAKPAAKIREKVVRPEIADPLAAFYELRLFLVTRNDQREERPALSPAEVLNLYAQGLRV